MAFGFPSSVKKMEINAGVPDNYCQGEAAHLDPIDLEEVEFPAEDRTRPVRITSVKVTRGRKHK